MSSGLSRFQDEKKARRKLAEEQGIVPATKTRFLYESSDTAFDLDPAADQVVVPPTLKMPQPGMTRSGVFASLAVQHLIRRNGLNCPNVLPVLPDGQPSVSYPHVIEPDDDSHSDRASPGYVSMLKKSIKERLASISMPDNLVQVELPRPDSVSDDPVFNDVLTSVSLYTKTNQKITKQKQSLFI